MNTEITLENYEQKRAELVELNSNLLGIVLREKELKLDEHLSVLKQRFIDDCGGKPDYNMLIGDDKRITDSELYEFCSFLPKGGDLHVHDMALLPARELIELLKKCPQFCINDDKERCDLRCVPENEDVPSGFLRFSKALESGYYSTEELIDRWTFSAFNSDRHTDVWPFFEDLFCKHDAFSFNMPFAALYYDHAFRYYCKHNIIHVEIHLMLTESLEESSDYVKVIRQAYYDVKRDFPYFTVRIIGAGVKADNKSADFTRKCFLNSTFVQESIKDESDPEHICDFLIGFDLVNEEDTSLPLHSFAPLLLKAKKHYPNMNLYIHGGESLDAGNDNLIDAYLLGVSRVGHGLNLYRYPDLHSRFVKSEICLECCPISNQRLGYTTDIRNHPATEYLRTGMAISLCSDDPTYMENETLTDDFFAAIVCWDLGIAEIKQLCINSIMYSGLESEYKYASLRAFNKLWNDFVDKILNG